MSPPGDSGIVLPRGLLLGLMAGSLALASMFAAVSIVPTPGNAPPPAIIIAETNYAPPQVSRHTETELREDHATLSLGGPGQRPGTDYLVRMAAGDAMALSWTATTPLTYELHGHDVAGNAPGKEVRYFATGADTNGNSYLVAPADGFYGFFFQPKAGAAQVSSS